MPRTAGDTKILREKILESVYNAAWGSISRPVQWKPIGQDLGLSIKEIRSFILTLEEMGYVRRVSSDTLHVTLEGISKIEDSTIVTKQLPSVSTSIEKPVIFISHINEDKKLAVSLKSLLESAFKDNIVIFVSSDKESIPYGRFWFSEIKQSLSKCSFALILCSISSIKEPWINFETGAAFITDKQVIPLCYGGLEPEQLPIPLNYLQAARAYDLRELTSLFKQISESLKIELEPLDIADSDYYKQVSSTKIAKTKSKISAVINGGSVHKRGETIIVSGIAESPFPTADIRVYKLDKQPQRLFSQKIDVQFDSSFQTQFATADFPEGQYGATIELPTGTWTRIQFLLE